MPKINAIQFFPQKIGRKWPYGSILVYYNGNSNLSLVRHTLWEHKIEPIKKKLNWMILICCLSALQGIILFYELFRNFDFLRTKCESNEASYV